MGRQKDPGLRAGAALLLAAQRSLRPSSLGALRKERKTLYQNKPSACFPEEWRFINIQQGRLNASAFTPQAGGHPGHSDFTSAFVCLFPEGSVALLWVPEKCRVAPALEGAATVTKCFRCPHEVVPVGCLLYAGVGTPGAAWCPCLTWRDPHPPRTVGEQAERPCRCFANSCPRPWPVLGLQAGWPGSCSLTEQVVRPRATPRGSAFAPG